MKALISGGEKSTLLRNGIIAAAVIVVAAAMMVLAPRAQAAEPSEFVTLNETDCTLVVADFDDSTYSVTISGQPVDPGSTPAAKDFAPTAIVTVAQEGADDSTGTIPIPEECATTGGDEEADDEQENVDPVTIDGCKVIVPALQGVSYFQDKGNDPFLEPGTYNAKHFYPSTTFTAQLVTEDNPKVGEWTINVPEKCATSSDDSAKKAESDTVIPTKAPAAGM